MASQERRYEPGAPIIMLVPLRQLRPEKRANGMVKSDEEGELREWQHSIEERVGLLEAQVAGVVARVEQQERSSDEPAGANTPVVEQ